MKKFIVFAALAVSLLLPLAAQAAPLSADDKKALAQIEAYFNGITTLQARFLQVASTGATAQGILSLKRPGLMRFEYDAPSPILLVSDGTWLVFQDNELEQTTHVPLGSTPLSVLVEDPVDFKTGLEVLDVVRNPGVIRLLMRMRDDPEAGMVQMVFSDAPLALKDDLFKPQDFEGDTFVDK